MLQENKKKDKAEKENEKNNAEMTKGDPSNAFFHLVQCIHSMLRRYPKVSSESRKSKTS